MEKIPVRFRRVAAAFDKVARARICESSGSEHSPENSVTDLSDLVNSFIERDYTKAKSDGVEDIVMEEENEEKLSSSDFEATNRLRNLIGIKYDDDAKRSIRDEVERVWKVVGDGSSSSSSQGFKRVLMARLRESGFDAGLCKSKWEKTGSFPAGTYEYIDVNVSGTRYIVELFLSGQFEIARPTGHYASYIDIFPQVFVGKVDELKQVVRLMCTALRESMKKIDMRVPPWRKNGYMQAKWFGTYKRTTNAVSEKAIPDEDTVAGKQSVVGFDASASFTLPCYNCRGDFSSKVGMKVGYLAAAFNGNAMQLK